MPLTLAGKGVQIVDPLRDVKVWQNDSSLVNLAETKGAGNVPSPESNLTRKPRSPM
ncbi:MAG: hypothetical protein U0223_11290 [Nitrospira sp.]|nr:hypothetical protein [Nitrospira sp.]